jgi:DNA-binding MarR family transcriptional regulator
MIKQTSINAFVSYYPKLSNSQAIILNFLDRFPSSTRNELSEFTGIKINIVTPRINELIKKNLVIVNKTRFDRFTGKMAEELKCI